MSETIATVLIFTITAVFFTLCGCSIGFRHGFDAAQRAFREQRPELFERRP